MKIKGYGVFYVNYATFSCGKSEMYYQFIISHNIKRAEEKIPAKRKTEEKKKKK